MGDNGGRLQRPTIHYKHSVIVPYNGSLTKKTVEFVTNIRFNW